MKKKELDLKKVFVAFANHVWLYDSEPKTIVEFAEKNEFDLLQLKNEFETILDLRAGLLEDVISSSILRLKNDENFLNYEKREQALALFFTLIEEFEPYKKYLKVLYSKKEMMSKIKDFDGFNKKFVAFTKHMQTDERINWVRKKLPNTLTEKANGLLLSWGYVINVWLADKSDENQNTDAAIEKTIHFYFDIASTEQLAKFFDFGKFVFATKVRW